ncbi:MAG: NAD(P)H-binding protein [Desulfuromonadales bacterium]|nr:NAD(P)H-binding protein [Desulfuromonadales bacterium]
MAAPKNVLVLGATGFIGQRLLPRLLERGVRVRCLTRRPEATFPDGVETVVGDILRPETLAEAFADIDTAYYLVHAMAGGRAGFAERDRQAALNFVTAADAAGLRRAIYLGGLGESSEGLSEHLASRLEVGRILASGTFALTTLRAAVIIGAGGASYEIIKALVHRLPVMVVPQWVETKCQPIAVGDVIRYLVGCLFDEQTAGASFDIGGPDILSYKEMMEHFARAAGETNLYIPVPVLTPKLSSYWVGLVTPIKASIAMPLIEGLRNEVICRESRIREILPFEPTPFDQAVLLALEEETQKH